MSKLTDRLLQAGAILAIIWFGWGFAQRNIISLINANQQIRALKQDLRSCKAE